jgi:hypothetical protein
VYVFTYVLCGRSPDPKGPSTPALAFRPLFCCQGALRPLSGAHHGHASLRLAEVRVLRYSVASCRAAHRACRSSRRSFTLEANHIDVNHRGEWHKANPLGVAQNMYCLPSGFRGPAWWTASDDDCHMVVSTCPSGEKSRYRCLRQGTTSARHFFEKLRITSMQVSGAF